MQSKKEVSCLTLTFFYDYLESHGLPRKVLQEGLPYPPEWLDDRLNWIDYATFLEIERRVATLFPNVNGLFYDIGLTFAATKGLGFIRVVVRGLFSPYNVYSRFPSLVSRFLFPFITIRIEPTGPTTLHAVYSFAPECPPTEAFLDTVRGILSGVPPIMGAPPASVRMRRTSPLEVVFEIEVAQWTGLLDRIRAFFGAVSSVPRMRLKNLSEAAAELEEANRLLHEKLDALTEAKRELDRKVRDLTVLNALARAATGQLDARQLVRSAASVISRGLDGAPVALLLVDGDSSGLVVAASSGASTSDLAELRGLASPDAPATARVSRGPTRLKLGGRTWAANPMLSRERLVGAMLVGADGLDPALLESMAGQLAVSVENALSYRVIADLRDHLEIRVGERTAELEEARTRLQDTVVRLEQADRAKANFFTNVSHELRTPLTLILGPLEDMEAELAQGRTDELRPGIAVARRNAIALQQLVDEILDFAKLDAGAMPMNPVDLDLVTLASDVVDTLRPLADRKGISLHAEMSFATVGVLGDAALLRRVIVNLVGNALKYCRFRDRVVVRVRAEGADAILEVEDTGPGIPQEDQSRVFERFARGSTESGVEGTGIGLAMARDIVHAHAGELELDSESGAGSTFRVRLSIDGALVPAAARPTLAPAPPPVHDAANLDEDVPVMLPVEPEPTSAVRSRTQVLVVEDNPEMRAFLVRILSREHQVRAVSDAREALAIVVRHMPDVVVSDVMMAHVDGLELCRRLKASGTTRAIPILLVSARHGSEAVLHAFSAGADDYVTKPFSPPELLARVDAQLRIRSLATTLMRMEKQYSLGVLSAGIAHEMLNPLNAVINAVPPMRRAIDRLDGPGARDTRTVGALLDAIEVSGQRMHTVVKGILAYTRQDPSPRPQHGRLSDEIEAVLTILQYRLQNVTVHRNFEWDEPVLHYPEWIDQVVMNLVVNALDAMGEAGELWITVDRTDDSVCVRVRDAGPGVPPELRERIFTPFFTTKPPGKGTGLGLAIAREIIALHRGTLELDSSVRQGAEFVVTLPLEHSSLALEA